MNCSRKVLICLVLCSAVFQIQAQQQYPKTLLWRISGKGLTEPSYLFGTMHLNDKRLFNFGDSVYRAIERTAGLAIEVNPDELCAYFVNQLFDELENSKKLEDILDERDYKRYGPALSKKFDKSVDEITARDIVKEKNKWMQDLMEKGEMPTFVDAYLFNIARRQGKWLGGIEDMSDQAGLMEDLVDKSDIDYLLAGDSVAMESENKLGLDQLIDIYIDQDLTKIEAGYNSPSSAREKDLVLIKRNVKMARRIDSLTALRTMFLAIGAAHLPGDSGVIHLLQQRGFTVEPVFSSKKIAAKDYKFKEVQLPWVQVKDEQELYKVEMPANPASVKLMGMMEMKFLFDIFNMSGFCTMAVVNPGHTRNKDSLMSQLARRMFPGKNSTGPTSIVKDGIAGKEYIQKQDGSHIRLQIFALEKIVYVAVLASVKKEAINSPDADKFFKSFTINKNQPAATLMRPFTDSIMGITLSTPSPLAHNKQFSVPDNESYKITAYTSTDAASGSYIMLFSREVRPGYYILSDSVVYVEFFGNVERQYDQVVKKEMYIQGHKAAIVSGRNMKQKEIFAKALSVIRDNRNIMIMVIGDSSYVLSPSVDNIFNSIRFIDPPKIKWNTYQAPDKSSSAWAPGPFRLHEESAATHMIAYDTASSTTFFITPDTMKKYTWVQNDSTFWALSVKNYFGDSTLYEKKVQNGDVSGREWMLQEGSVYSRIRVLPSGNIIYKIFVVGGKELLESENTDKFFESFRLNGPGIPPTYLESKATLLLQDLRSEDSATRADAFSYLPLGAFSKQDLPMLHEALVQSYQRPYDFSELTAVNERLGEQIAKLSDSATLVFLEEQYNKLGKEKDPIRAAMLSTLAGMQTEQSYNLLTKLMSTSIPNHLPDYHFGGALRDTILLTAKFYPGLQQHAAKHEQYGPILADVVLELLDSGLVKKEVVAAAENDFIQAAAPWVEKLKLSDSLQYKAWRLVKLLSIFNTPASNNALQQFLTVKSNDFKQQATLYLLKNDQAVPGWVFDTLAADRTRRNSLHQELTELKKVKLFPKKYLTQAYFAESDIASSFSDYVEPGSLQFVKMLKAKYKGKQYRFYLYKADYNYDDSTFTFLGVSGGWDTKGKKLESEGYLSGFYYDEAFDAARLEELLEAYLRNQAEDEEEEEEEEE